MWSSVAQLFGIPRGDASNRERDHTEALAPYVPESKTPEKKVVTMNEIPSAAAGSASSSISLPPPLKRRHIKEMITTKPKTLLDKYVDIAYASDYYRTLAIPITRTRVENTMVEKPNESLSVYHCKLCLHCTQQKAEAYTHIC